MKRKLTTLIITSLCLIISLTACGNTNVSDTLEPSESQMVQDEVEETEEVVKESEEVEEGKDNVDIANWGISDEYVISTDPYCKLKFKVPSGKVRPHKGGRVGLEKDNTLVVMKGGHFEDEVDFANTNIIEKDMETLVGIMENYQTYTFSNFMFEFTNSESLEINGYKMTKYEGVHTYLINEKPQAIQFVAYSTQLSTGAYLYWFVIDQSEDQSMFETIKEHALMMAYSLEEVTSYF